MAEERQNRTRRFNEICNKPAEPVDPCVPIVPVRLHRRPGERNDCRPLFELVCDYNGLRNPNASPLTDVVPEDVAYTNKEIIFSCYQIFGDDNNIINGDEEVILVRAGEFTSLRSQEEADGQAEASALSRLNCVWGNRKTTVNCKDGDGELNDSGSAIIAENTNKQSFDPTKFNLTRVADVNQGDWLNIGRQLQDQVNDAAYAQALNELECTWVNENVTVYCFDKITGWVQVQGTDINGFTSTWYVTTDTYEKISDNSILIDGGQFNIIADTDIVDVEKKGTEEFTYTVNYEEFFQRQANEAAKANGLENLDCLFENVKMTIKCCEAFDPEDESKTLEHKEDHLMWYYDTHESSGNPPVARGVQDQGKPSKEPKPGVFDNIQPYSLREELKFIQPWIGGQYNANVEKQFLNNNPATDKEIDKTLLSCKDGNDKISVERNFYRSNIFRTIHGFTERCNNKFIDSEYQDQEGVTIETAVAKSENRGEAYQIASDLAKAQLDCRWGNDALEAAFCEPDVDGNPVDPRSSGSEQNPVTPVTPGQFTSTISKNDANSKAEIYNNSQLNCYWSNAAYDVRCIKCQHINNDEGTFVNQAQNVEPVFFRATDSLHLIYDHCGNRLQNQMVYYYELYEAEYQRRQLLTSNERSFLSDINVYLLNPPENVTSVTNPQTGKTYSIPNYETLPPPYVKDENNNYADLLDPNEYYYNERKGRSFKRKDDDTIETDESLYFDLNECNEGEGSAYSSHMTCSDYVQPEESRDVWAGAESVSKEIVDTDANIQILIETGNFISRNSQNEANTLAESFGLSQLNCYYENDLLDVRCEDCNFGERELTTFNQYDQDEDVGIYNFIPSQDNSLLFHPDPRWSATNALIIEQNCVFVRSADGGSENGYVRSGYDHRGNLIENKCNHAPGAIVRHIVNQGNFQSSGGKEEANELAELFALSQLNCYWENPDVTRYCDYCGFNAVNHDICFENPFKYKCKPLPEGDSILDAEEGDQDCISCSDSFDCPDCYDPRNRLDNLDEDLWNTVQDPKEGKGCPDSKKNAVATTDVEPKYSNIHKDCCCTKYATGAVTEVTISRGSTNSQESLKSTVDLSKNLADTNLDCLFGNDEILVSCQRDFPNSRVVQVDNCKAKDEEGGADVSYSVYKDAQTSYESFNKAQELAEKQAFEIAKIKCNAASQWLNQTWNIDTGFRIGVKDLGDTNVENSIDVNLSFKDANFSGNNLVIGPLVFEPLNGIRSYDLRDATNITVRYINNLYSLDLKRFIYDSVFELIYDFDTRFVYEGTVDWVIVPFTFMVEIMYTFEFKKGAQRKPFTVFGSDKPRLYSIPEFDLVFDLNKNTYYKVPINDNNTITLTYFTDGSNTGLYTVVFTNTYCLTDCDFCLGPTVPNIYNAYHQANTTINQTPAKINLDLVSTKDTHGKTCGEQELVSVLVNATKNIDTFNDNKEHYKPSVPIILVASVHVDGVQFNQSEKYGTHFGYSNVPLAVKDDSVGFKFSLEEYEGTKGLSFFGVVRDCGDNTSDDYEVLDRFWRTNGTSADARIVYVENIDQDHVLQTTTQNLPDESTVDIYRFSRFIENNSFNWGEYSGQIINWYLCPFAKNNKSGLSFDGWSIAVFQGNYSLSEKCDTFADQNYEYYNGWSRVDIRIVKSSFTVDTQESVAINPFSKESIISSPCTKLEL